MRWMTITHPMTINHTYKSCIFGRKSPYCASFTSLEQSNILQLKFIDSASTSYNIDVEIINTFNILFTMSTYRLYNNLNYDITCYMPHYKNHCGAPFKLAIRIYTKRKLPPSNFLFHTEPMICCTCQYIDHL